MPHIDLLELPFFDRISIDDLVALVDLMDPCQFEAGDVIVEEGDKRPQPLYIATSGALTVSKMDPTGRPRQLAELRAPTLWGEIELFCGIPVVCTTRAVTRVSAFVLERDVFSSLFEESNPAISRFIFNVARVACHRLAISDQMLTHALGEEDLADLRRRVFVNLGANPTDRQGGTDDDDWSQTTGVFRRPDGF